MNGDQQDLPAPLVKPLPPDPFQDPAVFIDQDPAAVLVTMFPFTFVVSLRIVIRPGESACAVILALEPGPFIPAALKANPGAFPVGQPAGNLAGIGADNSTGKLKNDGFFPAGCLITTAEGNYEH